jgi:protein TonB
MITSLNSAESFNELVFENRHKAYGAYVIRKSYNDNVTFSLLATAALCGLLSLAAVMSSSSNKMPDTKKVPIIIDTTVFDVTPIKDDLDPEPKKKEPVEIVKPHTDNINYKVDEKAKVDTAQTTNENSHIVTGGDTKGKVDTANTLALVPTGDKLKPENNDVQKFVDVMPEFNGNVYQFINDHIKYPQGAVDNGTSGLVVLSFIIEKDGSVKNINVLKGIADGCTEEAIRVVNLMPKWKPGKNHGEPMRVAINLPVNFKLK